MKNVKVLSFMAVSKGRAATEEVVAKRLQGVAAGTIEAVNPDLKTIKELFPHSQAQEETTEEKHSEEAPVAEEETPVDEQENNPFPDEQ